MITSAQKLLMARAGAVPPDRSWNIGFAEFNGGEDYGAFGLGVFSTGLFFKPDGNKMYAVSGNGDIVSEYSLATAWKIATASFVQSFSVSLQETNPEGLFFKPDGTKMYVVGTTGDDINEYDLSSAWDISTASYVQNFSVSGQDTSPRDVFFKPDGTKMYVVGDSGDDINEYDLSSAWDISTASYVQNFSVSSQTTTPRGMYFKDDGLEMYVVDDSGRAVEQYTLSSAWDISTASFTRTAFVGSQTPSVHGLFFKDDGTKMYILSPNDRAVYSYSLSTAWDISTISWDAPTQNYLDFGAQEIGGRAIAFKSDGSKFYTLGIIGRGVDEYDLSIAWEIESASFVQFFSVSSQELDPNGLFFKPDGTKMYVTGLSGDDVNEYTLSSAWDISTASYVQNFSVSAQETSPQGVSFKDDGTKMYIIGAGSDNVHEYTLSSAWDISTASFAQSLSVSGQDTNPRDVFFKPDGTKMYVAGDSGNDINEYTLSSAWDISTASYVQNFSVLTQTGFPAGLFFRDDGTKMYVNTSRQVYAYDIG